MKTESLEYRDGDITLRGFLAYDDRKSGRRPGVLVMPEAFGLGAQAKRRAERLAVAPDIPTMAEAGVAGTEPAPARPGSVCQALPRNTASTSTCRSTAPPW